MKVGNSENLMVLLLIMSEPLETFVVRKQEMVKGYRCFLKQFVNIDTYVGNNVLGFFLNNILSDFCRGKCKQF